MLHESRLKSKV